MNTNEKTVRIAAGCLGPIARDGFSFGDPFTDTKKRRFVSRFGVDPMMVAIIWNTIIVHANFPAGAKIIHLLWSLNFLKTYDTEANIAGFFGVDEKTYRNWNWAMITSMATMQVINFADRFNNAPIDIFTFMTVDGTDFIIQEPHPFSASWYSHKFKHAGLRYEIAISIFSGDIVWVAGPYPAGRYPDNKIVSLPNGLEERMMPFETYLADKGYRYCARAVVAPWTSKLRARHEIVNGMFKEFRCMRNVFRHNVNKHHIVAISVINIIALRIKHQSPLDKSVDVSVVRREPGPP